MSDEIFVCKYTVKEGKIVDFDAVPWSRWTCAVLTCSSLGALIFFAIGLTCGILLK